MKKDASKAQRIVDAILGGERYVNSKTFADRVYSDEPILRTGADAYARRGREGAGPTREEMHPDGWQRVRPNERSAHPTQQLGLPFDVSPAQMQARRRTTSVPKRYRELRRLEQDSARNARQYGHGSSRARLFAEQARLLADYEDDYEGTPDPYAVRGYVPVYEDLSNHDLRCYVSWRTRLKAGQKPMAPLWCVLLYAFELIGGYGVEPGAKGFEALAELCDSYAAGTSMEQRFLVWLHDYVVFYGLDPSLLGHAAGSASIEAVGVLRAAEDVLLQIDAPVVWPDRPHEQLPSPEELFDALVLLSRYRADRSKFFREHREDAEWVVCRVFADMVAHCHKRRKTGFVDGLFGHTARLSYTMFAGALLWLDDPHADAEYEVSATERYVCEWGFWWRVLPCRRVAKSSEIGALLHAVDARMRRAVGDKHELKDKPLPKYQARFVDARIAELVELRTAEEASRVVIDRSALGSIRSASARTRDALLTDDDLVDEEPKAVATPKVAPLSGAASLTEAVLSTKAAQSLAAEPDSSTSSSAAPAPATGLPLDEAQLALLRDLLDGKPPQSSAMFVSLAVDAINEAFLEIVGDTVIDFDGDTPVLVEDYVQDVRNAL